MSKDSRTSHPLFQRWYDMMRRCYQPKRKDYKHYGGRGIIVCARWHDFWLFVEDVFPSYSEGLKLDRCENDGNYEPSNFRWSTQKEQTRNFSRNVFVETPQGKMPYSKAEEQFRLYRGAIAKRQKLGFPDVLVPTKQNCIIDTPWGKLTIAEAAKRARMGAMTLWYRVQNWAPALWFDSANHKHQSWTEERRKEHSRRTTEWWQKRRAAS